jgi:hypothetical protein
MRKECKFMFCTYNRRGNVADNVLLTVHHSVSVSETNVMHFLFSLLRIKDLYMFRVLLAHPQDTIHKRHLVYCVRVM